MIKLFEGTLKDLRPDFINQIVLITDGKIQVVGRLLSYQVGLNGDRTFTIEGSKEIQNSNLTDTLIVFEPQDPIVVNNLSGARYVSYPPDYDASVDNPEPEEEPVLRHTCGDCLYFDVEVSVPWCRNAASNEYIVHGNQSACYLFIEEDK